MVLRVANLSFRHEATDARQVNNVSFTLQAGRTYGVLGGACLIFLSLA